MKSCLAVLGVIFLVLATVLGAAGVMLYATGDLAGLEQVIMQQEELLIPTTGAPVITVPTLLATRAPLIFPPTFTPAPAATQVPDPVDYRTRVLIRSKLFATALEVFMDTNARLQEEEGLFNNPVWRSEVQAALDEFVSAAESLGEIEPVPPEYQAIDAWLDQVGPEADDLRYLYLQALETGDQEYFRGVGLSLEKIIEAMTNAEAEMAKAGWDLSE